MQGAFRRWYSQHRWSARRPYIPLHGGRGAARANPVGATDLCGRFVSMGSGFVLADLAASSRGYPLRLPTPRFLSDQIASQGTISLHLPEERVKPSFSSPHLGAKPAPGAPPRPRSPPPSPGGRSRRSTRGGPSSPGQSRRSRGMTTTTVSQESPRWQTHGPSLDARCTGRSPTAPGPLQGQARWRPTELSTFARAANKSAAKGLYALERSPPKTGTRPKTAPAFAGAPPEGVHARSTFDGRLSQDSPAVEG